MAGRYLSRGSGVIATTVLHAALIGSLLHFDSGKATAAAAPVMVTLVDYAGEQRVPDRQKLKPKPKPKIEPEKVAALKPVERPEPAPAEPVAPQPAQEAPAPAASITLPRFNADYLNNPPPVYPPAARRMGEAGRVVLRVFVRADGTPAEIAINKSSGSVRLDQAALEAVRRWRFVPARQGDAPVEAPVLVPISFTLEG